jgi:hypothetical protein
MLVAQHSLPDAERPEMICFCIFEPALRVAVGARAVERLRGVGMSVAR